MIYLRCDTNVLMERIKKRARDYEQSIKQSYLNKLSQFYDIFFDHLNENYPRTKLIICDTTDSDAEQITNEVYRQLESFFSTEKMK